MIKMNKVKKLILYTPPLQNHYFWFPMEARIELQSELGASFIAIQNDTWKMILFRAGEEWASRRLGDGFGLSGEGESGRGS